MGTASDRTAITVVDAKTRECCAIFKSSTIQYKETFRFLFTLVTTYIPNCVLVVENNIDTLVEYIMNSSLKNLLYYEFNKDPKREKRKKGVRVHDQKNNILYGITTTSSNRPKYFDILFEMVRNEQEIINCEELVEEIELLEYKSSTRIEAVSGQHDDVIMSYLLAMYVLVHGNNKPRFGLLYADSLGTEYKNTDTSIFSNKSMKQNFSPIEKERTQNLLDNPFWTDLLMEYMGNDTAEDMEDRWKKSLIRTKEEAIEYKTNIFSSNKDEYGVHRVSRNAFFDLNAREDSLTDNDYFNSINETVIRDFEDDDVWF